MSASELGRALLACDTSLGNDPRQTAGRVLDLDRWRVRVLAGIAVFWWLLAVAGVFFMVWFYFVYLEPRLVKLSTDYSAFPEETQRWITVGEIAANYIAGLAAILLLAAVSTVWLVFATRRATLRQVNAQLREISEQLRQIQQVLAKSPAASPRG
jgi:hypothetical protein